jgi:hypothetical protein
MPRAARRLVALAATAVACGGGSRGGSSSGAGGYINVPPPAGGAAQFTVAPVDLAVAGSVTALGHINGGGHVEPTAHAYIYQWDLHQAAPSSTPPVQTVRMPATGTVSFALGPHGAYGDWHVGFRASEGFFFFLDHVVLQTPLAVGTVVQAGDVIGQTAPGSALDVGAIDANVTLTGFANPARYRYEVLHCVTPWEYFVEPIKSQLYAKMYRAPAAAPDQRIDQDVAGTLAGTWFDQSLPVDPSVVDGPAGWPLTISFAVDEYDGSTPRLSLGGWAATAINPGFPSGGVWKVPASIASWSDITPSSGLQIIPLYSLLGTTQQGLVLVQMLDGARIQLEIWAGAVSATAFDSGAHIYLR